MYSRSVLTHVFLGRAKQAHEHERAAASARDPPGHLQIKLTYQCWRRTGPVRLVGKLDFYRCRDGFPHFVLERLPTMGFVLIAFVDAPPRGLETGIGHRQFSF